MRLLLANHSSYPRVGEGPHLQRLRRAYGRRETGRITEEQFQEIVAGYIAEVIGEQEEAGLDVVTDGIVSWYDLISHPASRLAGVRISGLVRFFDTNTYIRQPEITGEVGGTYGIASDFTASNSAATRTLKAVLPGPCTLARHSIRHSNGNLRALASAYAEALGAELAALDAAGCTLLQIEEPSLLRFPEDIGMAKELLGSAMSTKGSVTTILATYFGDATPHYAALQDMPTDVLAYDLIYGPGLVDAIVSDGSDKPLAIGAIDGRNTMLEDTAAVARLIERVAGAVDVDELYLQPSCGLEFLPRDRAQRKLTRMREVRDAVQVSA